MQRTAVLTGGELAIQRARLRARLVGHHQDERVEARIAGVDALQTLVRDLLGRDFTGPQPAPEFFDGHDWWLVAGG